MTTRKTIPAHLIGEVVSVVGMPPAAGIEPYASRFSAGPPDRISGEHEMEWDADFTPEQEQEWDRILKAAERVHLPTMHELLDDPG